MAGAVAEKTPRGIPTELDGHYTYYGLRTCQMVQRALQGKGLTPTLTLDYELKNDGSSHYSYFSIKIDGEPKERELFRMLVGLVIDTEAKLDRLGMKPHDKESMAEWTVDAATTFAKSLVSSR